MKSSDIGGQAVLEGVMMKNKEKYAIAIRKPDNEIVVELNEYRSISEKNPFFKLPIIRGVVAFVESLGIGIKTLTFSAGLFEEEESIQSDTVKAKSEKTGKAIPEGVMNALTVIIAIVLAVGIFMVLPYFISQLLNKVIESARILTILECFIRIILFIGYIIVISRMEDIKRVFMYHGAEHKAINCIENGYDLTIKNVRLQSKYHKCCDTSFSIDVIFLSVILFMFINVSSPMLRLTLRLLLVPVIAGLTYEFIKFAGRSENKIVETLLKPGSWMQGLTTKEPDNSMIEVAIASVEAIFDWNSYLDEYGRKNRKKSGKKPDKMPKVEKQKEDGELTGLDKILEPVNISEQEETKLNLENQQKNFKYRIRNESFNPASVIDTTEEDEVLSALDRFFVSDNIQVSQKEEEGDS